MADDYISPLAKYSLHTVAAANQMGVLDTITHGTMAAVVDAGTTLWNSITPERMNASTEDLLARIDQNALQVYNEYPDAVQFASFFLGSSAPIGLALKGMNLLRAGSKSVNWFSTLGKEKRLEEVQAAFEAGVGNTERVRQAQRAVYTASAMNALADNTAMTAAIAWAMSAHPSMEDYYKDFGTNFLLNVAIGGAIGGIGGHIISRGEITRIKMGVEKTAVSLLNKITTAVDPAEHAGVQMQQYMQNARNIQATLDVAADPKSQLTLTPFVTEHLKNIRLREEANAIRAFQAAASEDLAALDTATKGAIRDLLKDPRFAGFDSVKFLSVDEVPAAANTKKKGLLQVFDLFTRSINKKGNEVIKANEGVYSPVWGGFVGKEEAPNYATLADLGKTIEQLEKAADKQIGVLARVDAGIEHSIAHTAEVQADFASAFLSMESKTFQDLVKHPIAIAPDDLASMKAVYLRLTQLAREGEPISDIKIILTKEAPSYEAQQVQQIVRGGFSPSYLKEIAAIDKDRKKYQVYNGPLGTAISGLSNTAARHLKDWIAGRADALRKAALQLNNPHLDIGADPAAVETLHEIQHFPASVAFRQIMSRLADADGNILLYRGLGHTPTLHGALESYTLSPGKAGTFTLNNPTGLRMYKVHVDDIIGVIEDIGPTGPGNSNIEILVTRRAVRPNAIISSHEEAPSRFFSQEGELLSPTAEKVTTLKSEISFDELTQTISSSTVERIKELQALGYGFETIALRTGTPKDTIVDIITSGNQHPDVSSLIQFGDRFAIEDALLPTKRALALRTNLNKVPSTQMAAALNASTYKSLGQQLLEAKILSSPDSFVREIGSTILGDEARVQLHQIELAVSDLLGYGVGNTLFRSADAVLEKLGPVSEFITGFGKQQINLRNKAQELLTTPLHQVLAEVAKSDATLIELSQAINFQAAVKGLKIYKLGQFWEFLAGRTPVEKLLAMNDADFLAYANSVNNNGIKMMEPIKDANGNSLRIVTPVVDNALKQIQEAGRSLYALKNVSYNVLGKGDLHDIGFWIPANNPRGKQIAYAFDRITGTTTMLMAKTDSELNSFIERFVKSLGDAAKTTDIIRKTQQEDFNLIAGRHDPMYMAVADATKFHGGSSALAEIPTTPEYLAEIIQGYDHYINKGIDDIARIYLNPVFARLDNMSLINNISYSKAALSSVQRGATGRQDPGNVIKNILMGHSNLTEHSSWVTFQSGLQMIADRNLRRFSDIINPYLGKGARTEQDWLKVQAEMEAAGIPNLYKMFLPGQQTAVPDVQRLKNAYLSQSVRSSEEPTPRVVALLNGTVATLLLRFMEAAQPMVNMLSLPILTSGAINRQLAASYAGAKLNPMARFSTIRSMFDGVALMNSKHGQKWADLADKASLFKDDWRTVNGIFKDIRSLDPGLTSKAEQALDSYLVNLLSTGADYAETLTRKVAFFTAVSIATRAYPTLGEAGVMTFARDFMNKAIGNYAAAQRPAMFQGTVGTAMGLFQTYMITMAQTLFRQIETKNWPAMVKMLSLQAGIFGTSSLPGFHPISELIGRRYSDDNYDLTSSTFRAFDNTTAEVLLYGLPSQLVGLTTRGDIQPRLPLTEGVTSVLPAASILMQAVTAGNRLAQAAFSANENAGVAMLEALSMQSISRPIARMSELLAGHSMTSTGKLVSTSDEIYTIPGVLSRVFAARPVEEIKAREAVYLDSFYGSMDADKRKKVAYRLKSHLINGTLDQSVLENLAYEYLRTGTPTGWRAAVNEAIAQTKVPGSVNVREHLSKNSALMHMIDDIDF